MNLKYEILKKRSSKLHLDDLILILKCLYPHIEVINPYEEIIFYQLNFTEEQKRLICQLIYASCLFNQKYRSHDQFLRYTANEEDYINALALAAPDLDTQKPSLLMNNALRRMFIELRGRFGQAPFTSRQARQATFISKSYIHYSLQEVKSKGLLEIVGGYANRGYLYQLTDKAFL